MLNALLGILLMAVFVEGLVEYVKLGVQKNLCAEIISTIVLGMAIAYLYDLDLFLLLGLTARLPYVGNALTGICIARGSNYIFDLLGKYTEMKDGVEELLPSLEIPPEETHVTNHECENDGGKG